MLVIDSLYAMDVVLSVYLLCAGAYSIMTPPWVPEAFFLNIPVAIHRVVTKVSEHSWTASIHGIDLENLLVGPPCPFCVRGRLAPGTEGC